MFRVGVFVLAASVLISPVLACVFVRGNTLRVRERHQWGRRIIPSPGSYSRQECWIIKTNPGRAACDGEQSVGELLRSDTQIIVTRCGPSVSCTGELVTPDTRDISDHHQAWARCQPGVWCAASNKRPDWLHSPPTGSSLVPREVSVPLSVCLCSD